MPITSKTPIETHQSGVLTQPKVIQTLNEGITDSPGGNCMAFQQQQMQEACSYGELII